MNRIKDRLETLGVRVTVDLEGRADPRQFDIVHLFNFATPAYTQSLAENAWKYGIPFVVSTLCEDISLFQNQALVWAQFMTEYVRNGQDAGWYSKHRPDLAQVTPCAPFPNQWLAEHAAALYTNGAAESATIRRLYPGAHGITEIKLGYELGAKGDSEKFIKAYGIKDFILCVGRLEHRKNQLGLLKALEDSDLPVVLAAGGFSYQSDYAAAVKRFKRRGQTLILGRLDDEMLASAYAAAKVHVLPSWYELPGLVSLEAGCHGCNVVVTRNGTAPDYLGDQAFYCDPGDENSILLAVTQAFHSPIKHRLKEVVMANTWDKVGEQTRASYNKVLNIEQPLPTESTQVIDLAPLGVMDFDSGLTAFQDLLERGELAAKSRSYTEAHALLSQAEQMSPNSRRVLRARAATYLAESKVDESMRYFDRALAISTNDSKCLIGRGMCEMMRNNTKGAYDYFVKALRIDGNELIAINQLIQCAFTEGRFDDLQVILERYVASHPGDNEMRFCLAGCYYKQGRIASATEHNAKILAENPHHLGAGQLRDEIAKASSVQSMPKASAPSSNPLTVHSEPVRKANSSESSAAAVAPVVAPTISDTGVKQIEELEELKHRRQHLDVLARVDSMIQNAIFSPDQRERLTLIKGECLALTGDLAQAKSIFNAIVTANPISCRGICDQATLMIVDGDWQQARTAFEHALTIDPQSDLALAGLGMVAANTGDLESGWNYYQRSLKVNPENPRALLGSIELAYRIHRLPELQVILGLYLERHPIDFKFLYALAGCLFAQNKLREAAEEVEKILIFEPHNINAIELKRLVEERSVVTPAQAPSGALNSL
jgi:tetratricopeptide (TPR) repeat protein